ncbi:RING-H2 finger protein ATL74-like [Olea europaea var. sylvestris]|uniref:RING-H2 finger protein ATL74-like n=1 Tax=Olea europaea var. sylvestris TaxID=158386 RepID=UPI000C1D34E7|nr:RING-H2 finger protein ATL74-like [Olea europaea var. sylvestris]
MRHHRHLLEAEPSGPPSPIITGRKGSHLSESDFDANMVVILAALVCALVVLLGLNLLVRCILRRRLAERADVRLTTTSAGLKKQVLRELPVAVYGPGANIPVTECPICLGEFVEGEKIRVLPKCNHWFHVRCIDTWLVSHPSCPNCRHPLLETRQLT